MSVNSCGRHALLKRLTRASPIMSLKVECAGMLATLTTTYGERVHRKKRTGKKRTGKKRTGNKRTGKKRTGKKRSRKREHAEKSAVGKKCRYNYFNRSYF